MIFKIEVNNSHLPRLGHALGYTGDPADAVAFKAFVESKIIEHYKNLIRRQVLAEETAKINVEVLVPDDDVKSSL